MSILLATLLEASLFLRRLLLSRSCLYGRLFALPRDFPMLSMLSMTLRLFGSSLTLIASQLTSRDGLGRSAHPFMTYARVGKNGCSESNYRCHH